MSFQKPSAAREAYKKEQEERQEEYNKKNRLPEGTGVTGRITKLGEENSRQGNEMYVAMITTLGNPDEKGKRKNVDAKRVFVKKVGFHMDSFYDMLELAGYDLTKIETQDDMDDAIDAINSAMPACTFTIKHQTDSDYNDYEFETIELVAPAEMQKGAESLSEKGDEKEGDSKASSNGGYT